MDRYLDTLVHYISVSVFYLPHKVCLHVMVLGCYKNVPLSEHLHDKELNIPMVQTNLTIFHQLQWNK